MDAIEKLAEVDARLESLDMLRRAAEQKALSAIRAEFEAEKSALRAQKRALKKRLGLHQKAAKEAAKTRARRAKNEAEVVLALLDHMDKAQTTRCGGATNYFSPLRPEEGRFYKDLPNVGPVENAWPALNIYDSGHIEFGIVYYKGSIGNTERYNAETASYESQEELDTLLDEWREKYRKAFAS